MVSVEQQTLHRIVEKSFNEPTDPEWHNQWYLVRQKISHKQNKNSDNLQLNTETRVLGKKANSSRDLNVVPAWIQGYTGNGVLIAVVDTGTVNSLPNVALTLSLSLPPFLSIIGVYHNHTDLAPNYVSL